MSSYDKIHEWQTRLVLIRSNADHSACLELSLVVVDLVALETGAIINHETIVTYDALSYAWGHSLPFIQCICDGSEILLRDNLDSALRYLRQPQNQRYVWIDFLCINQQDDREKSVQIPLMRSIYSKASTVIVWLGESLAIEHILLHCTKECGRVADVLTCASHKEELWTCILDYTWFERTWVRQEVFAAKTLKVCSPYFSTSSEVFTEALRTVATPESAFNHKAVQNLMSLNKLYHDEFYTDQIIALYPEPELLGLLKQGKGFQASVALDHVFSVLGMLHARKHDTMSNLITYDKTYKEICGDVTRSIIRITENISILKWCTLQQDRSYAFKWPMVEVSCPLHGEHIPAATTSEKSSEFANWFDFENPIRKFGSRTPSESPTSTVSPRPLVLYGREWGTLSYRSKELCNTDTGECLRTLRTYSAEDEVDHGGRVYSPILQGNDQYRESIIYKRGFVRHAFERRLKEYETEVKWHCCGSISRGDIFVSFQPGSYNVVLRECLQVDDLYEFVGWGGEMEMDVVFDAYYMPVKDEVAYYLADAEPELDWWKISEAEEAPGPRKRFRIR